jgi:alanine dehydrogenase
MDYKLRIGLARMHVEAGERRDFLPEFVAALENRGAHAILELGYGSGMGLSEEDYRRVAPSASFVSREEVYQQDYVLVLRYPRDEDLHCMHPGACLITMAHYPTRPERVAFLRSLGVEVVSLDMLTDDSGRRLVENLRAVAWNGVGVAFRVLRTQYPPPGFNSPHRPPIQVTLLGAGAVGSHVMQAAIRYGDQELWKRMASAGIPGVQVTAVDYDVSRMEDVMLAILSHTDLLVDATQRPDPSQPVIPNDWIGHMPEHAVLLDLSVDPYKCTTEAFSVKGIEGIPHGNLDHYVFAPDDPFFDTIPECINTTHRRYSVSCYSWPGIYPHRCMEVYGRQIIPVIRTLIEWGGIQHIDPHGRFFHRAIARAMLSRWQSEQNESNKHGERKTKP